MELNLEAKKARNAYMKEWRKNNKKKVKGYANTYWEKKAKTYAALNEPGSKISNEFIENLSNKVKEEN